MKTNIKILIFSSIGFILPLIVVGQTNRYGISDADGREIMAMIKSNHLARGSLAYRYAVIPKMLAEMNYFSERLHLPTPHPIQILDSQIHVTPPWFSGLDKGTLNTNIPSITARFYAAKVTVMGAAETTNFFFGFGEGKLLNITRMENGINYMTDAHLDEWQKMPSLINTNQAYQLATQWLAAVDMDMTAVNKLKWEIHQLHYQPVEATNGVPMPFYYVDFGSRHVDSETKGFDEPLVEVQIVGATKELQELRIGDATLSRRPQMIITNAIELASIPDPPIKQLQAPSMLQTNSP